MSDFMQEQVTVKMSWHMIDGANGTEYFPADDFTMEQAIEQYPGKVYESATIEGHGARLSADGYLDCTEWSVYDSVEEAVEALRDMYGDDDGDGDDDDDDGEE